MQELNRVGLMGTISKPCEDLRDRDDIMLKGHIVTIETPRQSGIYDEVIVIAPPEANAGELEVGTAVMVIGAVQTYKNMATGKVLVYVLADEYIKPLEGEYWQPENEVELYGFIGRGTTYRETPYGRKITDIKVGAPSKTREGINCFIPAICWGNNAVMVKDWEENTRVRIKGRMQSRKYIKKYNDLPFPTEEEKTAYELSIYSIEKESEA